MTGCRTASRPGVISSRSEVFVQMSTTAAVIGLLRVVHDPRVVAELVPDLDHHLLAARPTARIASEENRNATEPPSSRPTRTSGWSTRIASEVEPGAPCSASSNEPNSDVAAITAVAIAMPFVIAFVEFPTASRPPRISAGRPSNSPDISAMPCALSEIGPYVSIDTIDADRREHPHPGEGDEVQPLGERCRPGRNDADDRAGDDQHRPHGRLEPDREARQDRRGRPGVRGLGDLLHRLVLRVGEVLREDLDHAREDEPDQRRRAAGCQSSM